VCVYVESVHAAVRCMQVCVCVYVMKLYTEVYMQL
jgi:hypothetical protein